MLARRVIPSLLVRGRTLVKGQKFDSWRSVGHAAQAARVHAMRSVDELMILDISATAENRSPDLNMVRELSQACFIPVTVGGGVRTVDHIDQLLRAGADKVAICTGLHEESQLVEKASDRFGSQAIVGVIECDGRHTTFRNGKERIGFAPEDLAAVLEQRGCGELMLTSVDRDGTMQGYDLETIQKVCAAVSIPVIASGGCGSYLDMLKAFTMGADACAAGAIFQFTDNTPKGAVRFLKDKGVEVRCD